MQLHDMLVTELTILAGILPTYQKATANLYQAWVADQTPESFNAYMLAGFELGKKVEVIDTLTRLLKEYDEQI